MTKKQHIIGSTIPQYTKGRLRVRERKIDRNGDDDGEWV